jgi:putative ABC transport system substrate-binding protein
MVAPLRAATLTVVYPKMNPPRDEIYNQIITGIKKTFSGELQLVSVGKRDDKQQIAANIDKQNPDMVITLANTGRKVGKLFKQDVPLVSGALPIRPNGISGISPVADPNIMFTNLKWLAPKVNKVYVVYSIRNQWLIDLAKVAAVEHGLELETYTVKSRADALVLYNQLIKSVKGNSNAFWMPLDSKSADDRYVLPLLLEASWEQNFVLFSSKPSHVARGVLFSLLPDNEVLGIKLVKMVQDIYRQSSVPVVKPTTEVQLAVNLRTASHLGLEYTSKQKGQFHLTFGNR